MPGSGRSGVRRWWERLINIAMTIRFPGSSRYWEMRYRLGGTSGAGSYGPDHRHKTQVLNSLLDEFAVHDVLDFGCGDGNQLSDLKIENYLGFDVSQQALARCRARYGRRGNWKFKALAEYAGERAPVCLSLDVLYHLVEDSVYFDYLDRLFRSSTRWVVIYSSNADPALAHQARHVRHRCYTDAVSLRFPEFRCIRHIPRPEELGGPLPGTADFRIFERMNLDSR